MITKLVLLLTATVAVVAMSSDAWAAQRGADGYYRTGSAIQTANHWPFTMDVFAIRHDVKQLPAVRTRQAMIDLDVDKRFSMKMLRELDADKLRGGLRDGYHRNAYTDDAVIGRFLSALTGALANGRAMWIVYDAGAKQTRLVVEGGATTSVDGITFMKATWSIWFGKSKPSDIGDALIKDL
jgi:hypothetical protein